MTAATVHCVLPSLKEMFPDHLFHGHDTPLPSPHTRAPAATPRQRPHTRPAPYSFAVLRSDPRAPSLPPTHIATRPHYPHSRSQSPSEASACDELEDISSSAPDAASPSEGGRKHVCALCHKRFNRPSSLKIHMNTHSGATPFHCPHPGCGRAFNVSSNMRRHLRNHAAGGAASASVSASASRAKSPQTPSTVSPTSPSAEFQSQSQSPSWVPAPAPRLPHSLV
ncbi:hypothetical protein MKEN_00561700 [Mycena kentingensis (nom. inval.)]|nr:hypothetical protein MKEN_00561700 [Mycena kentingensis (nom. inval.)]